MEGRNDDILYQVCQQNGGLGGFLEATFGFLQRRTDFYYEMEPPGQKMGFPPGVAEMLVSTFPPYNPQVAKTFKKYQEEHWKKFPQKADLKGRWEKYEAEQQAKMQAAQAAKKQVEQEPLGDENLVRKQEVMEQEPGLKEEESKHEVQPLPRHEPTQAEVDAQANAYLEKKAVDPSVAEISTYNGAKTLKYNWSQQIRAVDVQMRLPEGITKSKQLEVKIETKRICVKVKGQAEPLLEGELDNKVIVDETYWNIEDGVFLNINFEKAQEQIWKCVLAGDDEIDTKTVDNAKQLNEFDVETQGHLRKVLYEQERKRHGLLTTEEEQQREMMGKLMKDQNNPMAGTPYDPAKYGKNAGNNGPAAPFAQ